MIKQLTIATRESQLALWQAHHVADRLRELYPQIEVHLLPMTTRGDQILDQPLSKIGGKGLFLKELEVALLDGRADLAVHSLKDVPMQLEAEFQLAAIMEREIPLDAWVSNHFRSINELPKGARVGSSSKRRQLQLRKLRPDLQVLDLRGNLQTRLRKLDQGEFDGIVLAAAGLQRLGLKDRIAETFTAEQMLPAAGQGALGIECLKAQPEVALLLAKLNHRESELCTRAERAFSEALGGSCQVPIGSFACLEAESIRLTGLIGSADSDQHWIGESSGSLDQPEAIGKKLAEKLIENGAHAFSTTATSVLANKH